MKLKYFEPTIFTLKYYSFDMRLEAFAKKITGFLVLPPNFKTVQCFHDPFSDFTGN